MLRALDELYNEVHIEDAKRDHDYRCPYCREQLTMKCGEIRAHHFSHRKGTECHGDTWYRTYDMSEWHNNWQSCFPKENQELLLSLDSVRHRADVLIDRTVIEFQHTIINEGTFQERNNFYTSLDYKLVWLFDLENQFTKGTVHQRNAELCPSEFEWIKPTNNFRCFDNVSHVIDLFFQLKSENDGECIVKVESISERGVSSFKISRWYTKEEFLDYIGLVDGKCALPDRRDILKNEEYLDFCKKYQLTLNQQQARAVQAIDGATLLLAVPGSGKTSVLVARLGYMIRCKGIPASSILALTYNRDAAAEMKKRFIKLFGDSEGIPEFQTINAFCLSVCKYYAKNRYGEEWMTRLPKLDADDKMKRDLIQKIYREVKHEHPTKLEIDEISIQISVIKNMMIEESDIESLLDDKIEGIAEIFKKYKTALQDVGYMDFDDQLVFAHKLLEYETILKHFQNNYRYICVDEAQDTSKIQHEIIRMLASLHNNVFMVGDEDQSIYGFRGAYPTALTRFKTLYKNPFVLFMENNYRSTPEIIQKANDFIVKNVGRSKKKILPTLDSGKKVTRIQVENRWHQFSYVLKVAKGSKKEIAVLYRNNESAIPIVDFLDRENIPYTLGKSESSFFYNKDVMGVIGYLTLLENPRDTDAFKHARRISAWGMPLADAEKVCEVSKEKNITIIKAFREFTYKNKKYLDTLEELEDLLRALKREESPVKKIGLIRGRLSDMKDFNQEKMEILYQLAKPHSSISGFLKRYSELKEMFSQKERGERAPSTQKGIILSTVHASKGREYDTVYLIDVFDGAFPMVDWRDTDKREEYQEERRLFYVAMTRAKRELCIFHIKDDKECSFVMEVFKEDFPKQNIYCPMRSASTGTHEREIGSLGYRIDRIRTDETQNGPPAWMNEDRRRATEAWLADSRRLESERIRSSQSVKEELDSTEKEKIERYPQSPSYPKQEEKRYTCTKCRRSYKSASIDVFSPVICIMCNRGWR